jgi:hypothetical protein
VTDITHNKRLLADRFVTHLTAKTDSTSISTDVRRTEADHDSKQHSSPPPPPSMQRMNVTVTRDTDEEMLLNSSLTEQCRDFAVNWTVTQLVKKLPDFMDYQTVH